MPYFWSLLENGSVQLQLTGAELAVFPQVHTEHSLGISEPWICLNGIDTELNSLKQLHSLAVVLQYGTAETLEALLMLCRSATAAIARSIASTCA